MKKIVYKVKGYIGTYNAEIETEEQVECLVDVERPYSKANEAIAKAEAHNGEYTIEDDGQPEPEPTAADRIAELEATINALLGVTE